MGTIFSGNRGRRGGRRPVHEAAYVVRAEHVSRQLGAGGSRRDVTVVVMGGTQDVTILPGVKRGRWRVLLECPACGTRAARLYQVVAGGRLACRRCHRLAYRLQFEHYGQKDRMLALVELAKRRGLIGG